MQSTTFRLPVDEGVELFVYRWEPSRGAPKGVVQIAHGMAEHAGRYARTAGKLVAASYAVYAQDHRGHGRTANTPGDLGYFADHGGFQRAVDDLDNLYRRASADHPGLPVIMLGHSMGSLLVRRYLSSHGDGLAGAVLSGTNGGVSSSARIASGIALLERLRVGARGKSALLQNLTFGAFNKRFEPVRTEFDWLSRDTVEVDKYIADELCGFSSSVQAWIDLFGGILEIEDADDIRRIPRTLPVYVFSGERDPVGAETSGPRWLIDALARAGVTDVTHRFYPGGRHEMLNEINRDEVHRDLLGWLDTTLDRRARANA